MNFLYPFSMFLWIIATSIRKDENFSCLKIVSLFDFLLNIFILFLCFVPCLFFNVNLDIGNFTMVRLMGFYFSHLFVTSVFFKRERENFWGPWPFRMKNKWDVIGQIGCLQLAFVLSLNKIFQ